MSHGIVNARSLHADQQQLQVCTEQIRERGNGTDQGLTYRSQQLYAASPVLAETDEVCSSK